MIERLGRLISRTWPLWLAGWGALLAGLWISAPEWSDVAEEGDYTFLPADAPTRRGERLLEREFPEERTSSTLVLVLSRDEGLTEADRQWVGHRLVPLLQQISEQHRRDSQPVIVRIRTPQDEYIGPLLVSRGERAMLLVLEIATEYRDNRTRAIVNAAERRLEQLRREDAAPSGLEIHLTGSAAVGRDMARAREQSAEAIQSWTTWIVIGLLLIVYRAPLVALVPLAALFIAVQIALKILAHLAQAGYIGVFAGLEVYTLVLVYGAGVDYSLFVIARYREELGAGLSPPEAASVSIGRVGTAIVASALTEIVGIAMLLFASFRKFQQAGVSVPLGLFITFCATLTLAPALLRLLGRWAFWPQRIEPVDENGRPAGTLSRVWEAAGRRLESHPGLIWLLTVLVMAVPAAYAVRHFDDLSYGLLDELPQSAPSVQGTEALQRYFPAGAAGSVTVLIRSEEVDFSRAGRGAIATLTNRLADLRGELPLADVRSAAQPLGLTQTLPILERPAAARRYVSEALDGHVTRLDLVPEVDPFTRASINQLDRLEEALREALPESLQDAEVYLLGPTANLRDLKRVAERDRTRIMVLVTAAVFAILMLILRRIVVSLYLILTVLFSFLVALGVTYGVFRLQSGPDFAGLDWTVPIFLFTLLTAVGVDYNIYLVSRINEEQQRHGPIRGILEGLRRTGGIISSCGIIMAGTFASLSVGGELAGMYQLGFALAFGVLLDTFIVRPILVPAFLILLHRRK